MFVSNASKKILDVFFAAISNKKGKRIYEKSWCRRHALICRPGANSIKNIV